MEKLNYEELKSQLIKSDISFNEVFEKLLAVDQSSGEHEACALNLQFLYNADIKGFIENSDEEDKKKYYMILCLSEWHQGQNDLFDRKDAEGLDHFKKALVYENIARGFVPTVEYMKGSIAYLENNLKDLEDAVNACDHDPKNKRIMVNMVQGLKERGYPDYPVDYMKH